MAAPASARETITLVADPWCPYTCAEEDERPGYMLEIAREALALHGITVRYKVVPWSRAVEQTRTGRYTAIVGAAPGDAPDFIYPATLQGMSDMRLWVRNDASWTYAGLKSLAGQRIGAIADYAYGEVLDRYIEEHAEDKDRVQMIGGDNALTLNIRKLRAKRIDVMPEDANVIKHYASTHGTLGIKPAGSATTPEHAEDNNLFVAFSPKNKESERYAALLDKGVKQLRKSGRLK
jgi:polar amino acid transport system substrate-binding protein